MSGYEGMLAEAIEYAGFERDAIEAYFARPLGSGSFPGVVVVHYNPGWDEPVKEVTRGLSAAGYAAVCPHLFTREGRGFSWDDAGASVRAQGGISDDQAIGDIEGAANFLRLLPQLNGRVGVLGFCSGGRLAYLAACRITIEAAVDAYGSWVVPRDERQLSPKQPVWPLSLTKDMAAPLLGLFGAEDQSPSPDDMAKTEAELRRWNKPFEFHSYPGARHSFMHVKRRAYNPDAANDAWDRIFAFFGRYLKEPSNMGSPEDAFSIPSTT
jgi:carboxymethylenebutenolidase